MSKLTCNYQLPTSIYLFCHFCFSLHFFLSFFPLFLLFILSLVTLSHTLMTPSCILLVIKPHTIKTLHFLSSPASSSCCVSAMQPVVLPVFCLSGYSMLCHQFSLRVSLLFGPCTTLCLFGSCLVWFQFCVYLVFPITLVPSWPSYHVLFPSVFFSVSPSQFSHHVL